MGSLRWDQVSREGESHSHAGAAIERPSAGSDPTSFSASLPRTGVSKRRQVSEYAYF
jgi:hypothetical protein